MSAISGNGKTATYTKAYAPKRPHYRDLTTDPPGPCQCGEGDCPSLKSKAIKARGAAPPPDMPPMTIEERVEKHADASGKVPLWWTVAMRKSGACLMARDVLSVIASYADKTTAEAWPSQEIIAATLGVSKKSVEKGIEQLEALGVIRITRRNRRKRETNLYKMVWKNPYQANPVSTYNQTEYDDFYTPEELAAAGAVR